MTTIRLFGTMVLVAFLGIISSWALTSTVIAAQVEFLGAAAIPGGDKATPDKSNLPHALLEDGVSYQDVFDGFGSGMAWTGRGNRYLLLCDRGPNKVQYKGGEAVDFTTSYPNRFHVADIDVKKDGAVWKVGVTLQATKLLKDEQGRHFTGISTAFVGVDPNKHLRLDSEGIGVAPDGSVWISDEYGPVIYHFSKEGKRVGTLQLPLTFLIDKPGATLADEMKATHNTKGRYTNRGAEGLALSPDGTRMVIAMQSALVQDGGMNSLDTRFLVYDLTNLSAVPKQYVYRQDSLKTANSEILAVNDHQFLVGERDGTGGAAGVKKLYLVDLNQSPAPTEVSNIIKLDASTKIVPLSKTLFADIGALLNNAGTSPFTTKGGLPDKIEGFAFGPDLPDGRYLLLATNDNDYSTTYPNYIFVFGIDPVALLGYQPIKTNDKTPW